MLKEQYDRLLDEVQAACHAVYGVRLASLAVFGSVARGTMRPDSDVDLLLVADPLPAGRMARMDEFSAVEGRVAPAPGAGAGVITGSSSPTTSGATRSSCDRRRARTQLLLPCSQAPRGASRTHAGG